MTTAWSHHPNAADINRVVASLETYPDVWGYVPTNATRDMLWDEAWCDACEILGANTVYFNIIHNNKGGAASRDAIIALLVWDDCSYMLDSNPGELAIIAALGNHRAILLLPACIAFNQINKMVDNINPA